MCPTAFFATWHDHNIIRNMNLLPIHEAIRHRHSVRHYISKPLTSEMICMLQAEIDACNTEGNLHIQLVTGEPRGFSGLICYGQFSGVENYFVMAGRKADDLNERIGYYGERLVLLAERMGLGTCWAGLTYSEIKGAFTLAEGEHVACMISLGYPDDEGRHTRKRPIEELSNISTETPDWFRRGMEAARLAPTAVNQQKFRFEYVAPGKVRAHKGFSLVGYTETDLGIAKLHFELAAGKDNFEWV